MEPRPKDWSTMILESIILLAPKQTEIEKVARSPLRFQATASAINSVSSCKHITARIWTAFSEGSSFGTLSLFSPSTSSCQRNKNVNGPLRDAVHALPRRSLLSIVRLFQGHKKRWLFLGRFSRNSHLLDSITVTFLIQNFMQIRLDICKIWAEIHLLA